MKQNKNSHAMNISPRVLCTTRLSFRFKKIVHRRKHLREFIALKLVFKNY